MRTIVLRFFNNFALEAGTISEHQEMITEFGFVWYVKLGTAVSSAVTSQILENEEPKILLIHSVATGYILMRYRKRRQKHLASPNITVI